MLPFTIDKLAGGVAGTVTTDNRKAMQGRKFRSIRPCAIMQRTRVPHHVFFPQNILFSLIKRYSRFFKFSFKVNTIFHLSCYTKLILDLIFRLSRQTFQMKYLFPCENRNMALYLTVFEMNHFSCSVN